MAKQPEETEAVPAAKLNTKLSPMFRQANEPDGKVPFAHEIGGLHIQVPDSTSDNKSKRVKIPNEHWFLSKNGKPTKQEPGQAAPAEWVFDPSKTSEKEFEAHFGRGEYWIQPININNSFMACGRILSLGGPRRFQGIVLKANEFVVDGDIYTLKPGETFVDGRVVAPVVESEEEDDEAGDDDEDEEGEEGEEEDVSLNQLNKNLLEQIRILSEQLAQARMQPPAPVAPAGPSREEYWQTEISKLRTQYTDDTMRAHTKHIEEVARVRQEAAQEANQQRGLHEQAVANLRSAFQSELNGLKEGQRSDFENMRKDLREQVTSLRNEADALRKDHRTELDGLRKSHDEDMRAERARLGNELVAKTDETKESRSELREQLKGVESDFRLFRGTAESNLSAVRTAHETFVMSAGTETARLNTELIRAEMKVKDAERRAAELQKELDKKGTETDRIRQEADRARAAAEKETEEAEKALADEYRRAAEREVPNQNQQMVPQRNPDDEPPVPEYILKYGPGIFEQGKKFFEDNREQAKIASAAAQQAAAAVVAAQQATAAAVAAQEQMMGWMQQQQQRDWESRQGPQGQGQPQGQYWQPEPVVVKQPAPPAPAQQQAAPAAPVVQQPPPAENHPPAPTNGAGAEHAGAEHEEDEDSTQIVE